MKLSDEELLRQGYKAIDSNYADNKDDYEIYKQRAFSKYGKDNVKFYRCKSDTKGLLAYIVYVKQ